MKKRLKVAVSFLVTICLMFAGGGGVSAQDMMWDAADMYVMEQVETISENRELAGLTWNDETEIQARILLYAPNGEISGYIYHFITNGTQTGFMQIQKSGDTYITVNMGFSGDDILTRIMNETDLPCSQVTDGKIYYCGNYDYFCEAGPEEVYSLSDRELVYDIQNLQQSYQQYESLLANSIDEEPCQQEAIAAVTATTKYVPGFGLTSPYLKSMGNYSGFHNHCAPTAGTNVVLYWRYSRGASKLSTNPSAIFSQIHTLMGTTNTGGTSRSRIKSAMENYLLSNYSYSEVIVGQYNVVTFSKVKGSVVSGYPVILSVDDWLSSGEGHAVDVWGYCEDSGANYLCITDNQDRNSTNTPSAYLINCSAYSFAQGVYAGLAL